MVSADGSRSGLEDEEARRQVVLERLRQLRGRVSARNADLDEQQAEALADRLVSEVIDDLADEGTLRFERDRW